MPKAAFRTRGIKLQKRQFSTKIHFMDICPCLKHTINLIFSPLAMKRSVIGVYMKSSIYGISAFECLLYMTCETSAKSGCMGTNAFLTAIRCKG
jgi:hypothetical protein